MVRETLTTNRDSEYFSESGLRTLTGLSSSQWDYAILKELIDNALDAIEDQKTRIPTDEKRVDIRYEDGALYVGDNAGGITDEVLNGIYDFTRYVSSKRDYKTCTRGMQGNALKTVIGICVVRNYALSFLRDGQKRQRILNATRRAVNVFDFVPIVSPDGHYPFPGVTVDGISLSEDVIKRTLFLYRCCNPDVTFTLNGQTFPASLPPVSRTETTFVHWYTHDNFNELLQKLVIKYPRMTVKEFANTFNKAQRVVSQIQLTFKRLSDFNENPDAILSLYQQLKMLVNPPKPTVLERHSSEQKALLQLFGASEHDSKYKCIKGEFSRAGVNVPYLLEGFIFLSANKTQPFQVLTAVNNSVPYEAIPFYFEPGTPLMLAKKMNGYCLNVRDALTTEKLFEYADGVTVYLHFACPDIEFTDKAKTKIISNRFKSDLEKLLNYLLTPTIKEVRRVIKEQRAFNRQKAVRHVREATHIELMKQYFDQAFQRASGGYITTARQVFYALREIVFHQHGVDISSGKKDGGYKYFTQEVLTYFHRKQAKYEQMIVLERRGFFLDPFWDKELPLGTLDVRNFIANQYENKRTQNIATRYDFSPEHLYPHVLFIEKQGFRPMLQESKFLKEMNLGLVSGQGFGTRAIKQLIQFFNSKGITVYVLHDCDIAGCLIQKKLAHGSSTFEMPLKVVDVGLTVADVMQLGKRPEQPTGKKDYSTVLYKEFTAEEREFFFTEERKTYNRVELNSMTNPELLDFLRQKITQKPVIPPEDILNQCVDINMPDVINQAFHAVFEGEYKQLLKKFERIDKEKIAAAIVKGCQTEEKKHWTDVLDDTVTKEKEALMKAIETEFRSMISKN